MTQTPSAERSEPPFPPPTPELIVNILRQLNEEVLGQLQLAKSVDHPGEGGRARENVLADALRRFVPDTYGVGTGFVIDGVGGRSRQIDIVIYRQGYHPVFVIGGVVHYMVEAVVAVIENKAAIKSRALLGDALGTIKSVKALDRTNRGTNYAVHGSMRGEAIKADDYGYQVWGGIVTEASLSQDVLADGVLQYLRTEDRSLWPNMYTDLYRCTGYYAFGGGPDEAGGYHLTDKPAEAERWLLTAPESTFGIPPLMELLAALANLLRVAPLVDYKPGSYFPRHYGRGRSWVIEASPAPAE